jgi:hypothetical protein
LSIFRVIKTEESLNSLSIKKPEVDLKKLFCSEKNVSKYNMSRHKHSNTQIPSPRELKFSVEYDKTGKGFRSPRTVVHKDSIELPLITKKFSEKIQINNENLLEKLNNRFGIIPMKKLKTLPKLKLKNNKSINFMGKMDFYFSVK